MRKFLSLAVLAISLILGPVALAQSDMPAGPPKMLRIYREEIKPGKATSHERVEAGYVRAFNRAKSPGHYLAVRSISGPSEAWFLEGCDSFAQMEAVNKSVEADATLSAALNQLEEQESTFRSGQRQIIAVLRPDLSYRQDTMAVPRDRYFSIETARVRIGFEADYVEAEKIGIEAHKKANVTQEAWAAYEVVAGMPSGTFLYFNSMPSLAAADFDHGEIIRANLGEDAMKKRRDLLRSSVITFETNIFAFSPTMSYVPADWAAMDSFWAPKAATTSTKPAAKPAAKSTSGGN